MSQDDDDDAGAAAGFCIPFTLSKIVDAVGAKRADYDPREVEERVIWGHSDHTMATREQARQFIDIQRDPLSSSSSSSIVDVARGAHARIFRNLIRDLAASRVAHSSAQHQRRLAQEEEPLEVCMLLSEPDKLLADSSSSSAVSWIGQQSQQSGVDTTSAKVLPSSPPPSGSEFGMDVSPPPPPPGLRLAGPAPAAPAAQSPTILVSGSTVDESSKNSASAAVAAAFWAAQKSAAPVNRLERYLQMQRLSDGTSSVMLEAEHSQSPPQLPSPVAFNVQDARSTFASPTNTRLADARSGAGAVAVAGAGTCADDGARADRGVSAAAAAGLHAERDAAASNTDHKRRQHLLQSFACLRLDTGAAIVCTELCSSAQACYESVAAEVPSLKKEFDLTTITLQDIELLLRTVPPSSHLRSRLEQLHTCKATMEQLLAFGKERAAKAASQNLSMKRMVDLIDTKHPIVAMLCDLTNEAFCATHAAASTHSRLECKAGAVAGPLAGKATPLIAVLLPAAGGAVWRQSVCDALAPELGAVVWNPHASNNAAASFAIQQTATTFVIASDAVHLLPQSLSFETVFVYKTMQQQLQCDGNAGATLSGTLQTITIEAPTFTSGPPGQQHEDAPMAIHRMHMDQPHSVGATAGAAKSTGITLRRESTAAAAAAAADAAAAAAENDQPSFTFLCSSEVTQVPSLLRMLEQSHAISVIQGTAKRMKGVDLVLSCTAGIKLLNARDLNSGGRESIKASYESILRLSEAYSDMHIIVQSYDDGGADGGGAASWSVEETTAFSKLKVCLWPFQQPPLSNRFKMQIHTSSSSNATAAFVRAIADSLHASTPEAARGVWVDTDYIQDSLSVHETALLGFPFLNSFSAQYLLSCFSLKELAEADLETLAMTCPAITTYALQSVYNMLSMPSTNFDPTALEDRRFQQAALPSSEYAHSPNQSSPGDHDTSYLWQDDQQHSGGTGNGGAAGAGEGAQGVGGGSRGSSGGGGSRNTTYAGDGGNNPNGVGAQHGHYHHSNEGVSGPGGRSAAYDNTALPTSMFADMPQQQQQQHDYHSDDPWGDDTDDDDNDDNTNDVWSESPALPPRQLELQPQPLQQQQQRRAVKTANSSVGNASRRTPVPHVGGSVGAGKWGVSAAAVASAAVGSGRVGHYYQQHQQQQQPHYRDPLTSPPSSLTSVSAAGSMAAAVQFSQTSSSSQPYLHSHQYPYLTQHSKFEPHTPQDPPAPAPFPNRNSVQGRAKRRRIDPSQTLSYSKGKTSGGQTTLLFEGAVPRCATGLWPLASVKGGGGANSRGGRR